MTGAGWWGHDWWRTAEAEGLMEIGSHSWDHNHETLPAHERHDPVGGRFDHVDDDAEAEAQVAQASRWLTGHLQPHGPRLLAWPYGQSSAFLRDQWMPMHAASLGVSAAFGTRAASLARGAPRWDLPRYVCGRDWQDADGLLRILR
jgi:peptidoglycan/xylan/chitin deacetylase (PgdA/CDA1 family)